SLARGSARAVVVPLQLPQGPDGDEDPSVAERAHADVPLHGRRGQPARDVLRRGGEGRSVRHHARHPADAAERRDRQAGLHDDALLAVPRDDAGESGGAAGLTDYLRDYIWSIGITQMRSAGSEAQPAVLNPSLGAPASSPAGPEASAHPPGRRDAAHPAAVTAARR